MKTLTVFGASDDLVESHGITGADEFNAIDGGRLFISSSEGALHLWCFYTPAGTWAVGVSQIDEDAATPSWPIRIVQSSECRYSMQLEIDCPDDARLRYDGSAEIRMR